MSWRSACVSAARRISALTLVGLLVSLSTDLPAARAIPRPTSSIRAGYGGCKWSQHQSYSRQSNVCARTITVADPNVSRTGAGLRDAEHRKGLAVLDG